MICHSISLTDSREKVTLKNIMLNSCFDRERHSEIIELASDEKLGELKFKAVGKVLGYLVGANGPGLMSYS